MIGSARPQRKRTSVLLVGGRDRELTVIDVKNRQLTDFQSRRISEGLSDETIEKVFVPKSHGGPYRIFGGLPEVFTLSGYGKHIDKVSDHKALLLEFE
jgi:hypothetical protein